MALPLLAAPHAPSPIRRAARPAIRDDERTWVRPLPVVALPVYPAAIAADPPTIQILPPPAIPSLAVPASVPPPPVSMPSAPPGSGTKRRVALAWRRALVFVALPAGVVLGLLIPRGSAGGATGPDVVVAGVATAATFEIASEATPYTARAGVAPSDEGTRASDAIAPAAPPTIDPAALPNGDAPTRKTAVRARAASLIAPPKAAPVRDDAASPAPPGDPGTLTVICIPNCDSVLVDGRNAGPSPIVGASLAPGAHRIVMRRTGSKTESFSVKLSSGQARTLRVKMD